MGPSARTYRLLIVDDNELDRRHYIAALRRQAGGACAITQTSNGAAGLAALRDETYDCVLLDFNLPDMTGIEFLAAARIDAELPSAFVLITGHGNEAVAVEAMKLGVQDYLSKDKVTPSSLWRAATRAVTQAELHSRLAASMRELTEANAALEQEIASRTATEAALRAAKDLAEQASQAKTRFAAMVTHELRTPLNGILGYAQLLGIDDTLSVQQRKRVDAMMRAGHHLRDMIESVLDFASIETGRLELQTAVIAVNDQIENCLAFIEPMMADHRLNLRIVRAPGTPAHILADPRRLRQVLLNLLGNAVKYTESGSVELRVLSASAFPGLRVEIADTGPGIDEAHKDRLFQYFERLDANTAVEGAGMGLAIASRIVGAMNGAIGYHPNPGGGSVFWVELPVGDAVCPLPPWAAAVEPPPVGCSILLAEDVAMNRDVIGAFLRTAGHVVTEATNGREAVDAAARTDFDLILMDVRMPKLDGLEATRHIRALLGPRAQVPIIALTAYSFPEQIKQCRDAGMNGHIAKPVEYRTLIRAIADITQPAAPAPPSPDDARRDGGPVLDRDLFDGMVRFLPPAAIDGHLRSLREQVERILPLLAHPDAPELSNMAHSLASTVGMFGFLPLSRNARDLEHALTGDPPAVMPLAQAAQSKARAAIAALDTLIGEYRCEPV